MKTIINQFVSYEIALALKELDFNEMCLGYYNQKGALIAGTDVADRTIILDNRGKAPLACLAPLHQQAIDFLEMVFNLYIDISIAFPLSYSTGIFNISKKRFEIENWYFDDINVAREMAILKCIELIKSKV